MLVLFSSLVVYAAACGTGLGGNDNEWIEDPVLNMEVSPPIGWTYFPTKATVVAQQTTNDWFFVGQSVDSVRAKTKCDAEIYAAMLDALSTASIPIHGVTITNDFAPIQIENPGTSTTLTAPLYGKVEAGALTNTGVGGTAVTPTTITWTPYSQVLKVSLRNAASTRFNWNLVKNTFMQKLALNFNARFVGEITVSNF